MGQTIEGAAALKSYVYFAEAEGGVYFGGGTEHFLIKGAGIYPLVSRLVSLLDGSRSIEAIAGALPAKARSFFGVLVGELREREMLRECLPSNDFITEQEWRLYRETLLYLRDRTAGYASLFRAWRARENVVVGGGVCAKALLRGLARTGTGRLQFLYEPCSASGPQQAELVRVLDEHAARDETFRYELIDHAALTRVPQTSRLIYASDHIRIGAHAGVQFAGGLLKRQAIVAGGADCGAILTDLGARMVEGQAGAYSAVTAPSIIGNLLAHEILRSDVAAFTNNPQAASADTAHFLHLSPGGETTRIRLPRRPEHAAPSEPHAFGFDLFDPLIGMFERLPALTGYRLPLPHARLRLRLPNGDAAEEIAWGVKQTNAETDVVLKAAARYAAMTQSFPGRVVAASSRDAWLQLALAAAIADSSLFAAAETRTVTLESLDDAEFHFLVRIARLYGAERPAITLSSAGDWPAFIAEAQIGAFTARAISACGIAAMCNALGQACSQMQLAETGRSPELMLVAIRTAPDTARASQTMSSEACIALLVREGFYVKLGLHADAAFAAAGIHVGVIELARTGASR